MRSSYEKKVKAGYRFHETDTQFTSKTSISLSIMTFVGGFLSAFLGVGGATVYNPLLIALGKNPQVANATGMFVVLINSISTQLFYIGQGDFVADYQVTTGAIVLVASIIGIYISNNYIAKLGRASLIVFLLGIVVIISAVIVPILEVMDIVGNPHGLLIFNQFCPSSPKMFLEGFSPVRDFLQTAE